MAETFTYSGQRLRARKFDDRAVRLGDRFNLVQRERGVRGVLVTSKLRPMQPGDLSNDGNL